MVSVSGIGNNIIHRFTSNVHPMTKVELSAAKTIMDKAMHGVEDSLLDDIRTKAPKLIEDIDGLEYISSLSLASRGKHCLKSFASMPLDFLNWIAKKFPDSALDNADFLKKYREDIEFENKVNSLRGMYKNTCKLIKENFGKDSKKVLGEDPEFDKKVFSKVEAQLNKNLNKAMGYYESGSYDRKKERFVARIVSGFTAAIFLGTDFFNKAIRKGKSYIEAKKEQRLKQKQEIKENVYEGVGQFAMFSMCSELVNNSVVATALLSTGISLIARVISRKRNHMRLTRMEVPDNNFKSYMPSIKEYTKSIKENSFGSLYEQKRQDEAKAIANDNKKPLLTKENLMKFCLVSIVGGFALSVLKDKTALGKKVSAFFDRRQQLFNANTLDEIIADKKDLKTMSQILSKSSEDLLTSMVDSARFKIPTSETVRLGTEYKTMKLLGIEVKKADVLRLRTAPLRLVKEVVSYPYKIARKLYDAARGKSGKKADAAQDLFNIKNLYLRFMDIKRECGDDEEKLAREFMKYINDTRLRINNNVTASKGDNSQIAVMAQTLGTLSGMWFNMNDEFNSSIRNGSSKKEAEKDARLRGINKFVRMSSQIIISDSLNSIFRKQYNNSIPWAAGVVAASTLLTDSFSRVLTGMPNRKMTKEEIDTYDRKQKEGLKGKYYEGLDFLAS